MPLDWCQEEWAEELAVGRCGLLLWGGAGRGSPQDGARFQSWLGGTRYEIRGWSRPGAHGALRLLIRLSSIADSHDIIAKMLSRGPMSLVGFAQVEHRACSQVARPPPKRRRALRADKPHTS